MDKHAITPALGEIFEDFFEIGEDEFGPELTADQVEGWDSLNHVRLMLAIEQQFGVKFSINEWSGLTNIGELIALLERKV